MLPGEVGFFGRYFLVWECGFCCLLFIRFGCLVLEWFVGRCGFADLCTFACHGVNVEVWVLRGVLGLCS